MSENLRGAAQLRLVLTRLLADNFKAYELPDVGERFGLREGTEGEAMSSKKAYLKKRLNMLSSERLFEIASEISLEFADDELDALLGPAHPLDSAVSEGLGRFDVKIVQQRWADALNRRARDPEGAITLARTLLEDTMKFILSKEGVSYSSNTGLPTLYKLTSKSIRLAPDDHSEEAFKKILGNCQSIVDTLANLRNVLGDAHGSGPKRVKPKTRHAELAVNISGTMSLFLTSTWENRSRSGA